jgi:hypothetical protein
MAPVAAFVPGLVDEVRVGGDGVHLDAQLLQLGVVGRHVFELGRADEGEVGRVEQEDRPLALDVVGGDRPELVVVESLCLEFRDVLADECHVSRSFRVVIKYWSGILPEILP